MQNGVFSIIKIWFLHFKMLKHPPSEQKQTRPMTRSSINVNHINNPNLHVIFP